MAAIFIVDYNIFTDMCKKIAKEIVTREDYC